MHPVDKEKNKRLAVLLESLTIPRSHYEKAVERYESLGNWLHREQSSVAEFGPEVSPQGSFRLGLVIPPLFVNDPYDLDLVCQLLLLKTSISQKELKELIGSEIKLYAKAHGFKKPAKEKRRCWRLNYSDTVSFHLDILPAIPEDETTNKLLVHAGAPAHLVEFAVSITDNTEVLYAVITNDWPCSNPRGFAKWFEEIIEPVSKTRRESLVRKAEYASIDQVPAYDWDTPLQLVIRIMKRHRDIMFREKQDVKPISMIITTLAAHAYDSEDNLEAALANVLQRMPDHINDASPRVPNPTNQGEDFADKWKEKPELEANFRLWHQRVTADLQALLNSDSFDEISDILKRRFGVTLSDEQAREIRGTIKGQAPRAAPSVHITREAPQPWRRED